ncbi:MAG: hypothetical protein IGS38_16490 [Synechococcales cyanobacterium M58_A2018_015]|nr:hypothetical protein [Synechococcales cyanobacterium M58_A2018_015]
MAFFDVLQFRIHSVECVRETRKEFPEIDPDAIDVRIVAIDETGDADVSNPILAGTNFRAGSRVDFPVPLVLYQFNLNEITSYPRSYTALLTLTERDDEPFGSGVNDAIRDVARAINRLIGAVVGAVTPYGTVASIIAGALDFVLDRVFGALGSDMFPPQAVRQDMDSASFSFSGRAEGPLLSITCDGVGGSYRVGCSWARRNFDIPLDSTDPLVNQVSVILRTGGDNLRRASEVDLILGSSDSDLPRRRISTPNELPNNTTYHAPPISIDPPMRLSHIRRVGLQYYSGQDLFSDQTDNWNLDELSIRWSSSTGASGLLFSRAGTPLHRFSGDEPIRVWAITPGVGRDTSIRFRSFGGQFVRLAGSTAVTATGSGSEAESLFTFSPVGEGKIALQASNGRFLAVASSADATIQATDVAIGRNSIFEFIMTGALTFTLRAFDGRYVLAQDGGGGRLGAVALWPREWETFTLVF